jgi:DnaJ-class molecular chaperone
MSSKNKIVHKDQGHEKAGIPSSDLIFEIVEHGERGFKRQGDNLIYTAEISLLDALDSKPFSIVNYLLKSDNFEWKNH